MDISVLRKGRRLYANQDEIDKLERVHVKKVPLAPQGPAKYEVEYNDAEPLSVVVDNWKWGRAQPCKRVGFCKGGRRTLQMCLGSLECGNKKCAYLKIQKCPNKVDFNRSKRCMHCHCEAIEKHCSARKYIENDRCHKKMTVIYLQEHDCSPTQEEDKPSKEELEDILRIKPTKSAGQLQLDVVREALLSGKEGDEVDEIALKYSNKKHLQYIQSTINKKKRPGGSEIEAVRLLKDDFIARNLDENLIMCVGDDYVILSSEQKVRLGALISLGIVDEPVSFDGCESRAQKYTEIEMTTYDPILRRNVKLVSMFAAKPGENSENVQKMVQSFDAAVNTVLPAVASEYEADTEDVLGRGLDPKSYVGDEGGALWRGLCMAKGGDVKNKTISDFFHFKQDINRNSVYFSDQKSKDQFKSIMMDAYNAPTSLQAVDAEKRLEKLIEKKATNVKKMKSFKAWWWRRKARWQKWCRTQSSSEASSAEVANAKSLHASGYRKSLLDVVTAECASAVLEAAEKKRQSLGLKTVGRGPSAADRSEKQSASMTRARESSADAIQQIVEGAETMIDRGFELEADDIENAQHQFKINTKDTHRADRKNETKPKRKQVKKRNDEHVTKKQKKLFHDKVEGVHMDLLHCDSSMISFNFKVLDTMGYLEEICLRKESSVCSSAWCRKECHHLMWIFHNLFKFDKEQPIMYQLKFTDQQWKKIIEAFPENFPLPKVNCPSEDEQKYIINKRTSKKDAKCATCKKELSEGNIQATTEGPYRTIQKSWIKRTFFFCPRFQCMGKLPRNSFICPYKTGMTLLIETPLTEEQKKEIDLKT